MRVPLYARLVVIVARLYHVVVLLECLLRLATHILIFNVYIALARMPMSGGSTVSSPYDLTLGPLVPARMPRREAAIAQVGVVTGQGQVKAVKLHRFFLTGNSHWLLLHPVVRVHVFLRDIFAHDKRARLVGHVLQRIVIALLHLVFISIHDLGLYSVDHVVSAGTYLRVATLVVVSFQRATQRGSDRNDFLGER